MSTTTNDGSFREPSQLWEIVRAVAKSNPIYEDGMGSLECAFCFGEEDFTNAERYRHEATCPVVKARTLVEQAKEREQ